MHGDRIGRIRLFAEGENITKIQFPRLPDTAMPELILQEGSAISFDFGNVGGTKTVPNQVYVYAFDYVLIISAQESRPKYLRALRNIWNIWNIWNKDVRSSRIVTR